MISVGRSSVSTSTILYATARVSGCWAQYVTLPSPPLVHRSRPVSSTRSFEKIGEPRIALRASQARSRGILSREPFRGSPAGLAVPSTASRDASPAVRRGRTCPRSRRQRRLRPPRCTPGGARAGARPPKNVCENRFWLHPAKAAARGAGLYRRCAGRLACFGLLASHGLATGSGRRIDSHTRSHALRSIHRHSLSTAGRVAGGGRGVGSLASCAFLAMSPRPGAASGPAGRSLLSRTLTSAR